MIILFVLSTVTLILVIGLTLTGGIGPKTHIMRDFAERYKKYKAEIAKAEERASKLREVIKTYRHARLVLNEPIASEEVEDSLKKELFDIESEYPELITKDSPTQTVK